MDEFNAFLRKPYVLALLGVIILLTSTFEVMDVSIIFLKMKAAYGIFILGIYNFLKGIGGMFEDE